MIQPKLSIIIPAYNVADFIETCINSVLSQNYHNYELIIIDDGSTDATKYILCEFAKSAADHIHLFRIKNTGLSAARNLGIKKATGDYFILLDGDDFLAPGALQNIATAIRKHDSPDLIRFQLQDFYEDGHTVPYYEEAFSARPGVDAFVRLKKYHYIEVACAYAYKTDFFKRNHFAYAEGRLAEDFGLTPFIIASAQRFASIADICYNYRQRSGSITHDDARLKLRVGDAYAQLGPLVKNLSTIPRPDIIISYYIISFLTLAATLPPREYLKYHRRAKKAGLLRHIQPSSLRNLPRAAMLKFTPRLYRALFTAR